MDEEGGHGGYACSYPGFIVVDWLVGWHAIGVLLISVI